MKVNKSYSKRLRVTKNGKVVARAPGHNHFNARVNGETRLRRRRASSFNITRKNISRYLAV
jgi:ribosomal protein L35